MTSPADRITKALQAKPQLSAPNKHTPVAFLLAATDIGPLLLSRLDYRTLATNQAYGVGFELLETGTYAKPELDVLTRLLDLLLKHRGGPLTMLDGGANIGVHAVTAAKHLRHNVNIIAIEAQERVFYALAGNVTLNNCFNVRCLHAAIAAQSGAMQIPQLDFRIPGSYGSFECKRGTRQDTGQTIDYANLVDVQMLAIDTLYLPKLDLLKLDIEGMELEGLIGAEKTIKDTHPIIIVEHIKSDRQTLEQWFDYRAYKMSEHGMNIVAIYEADPCVEFFNR